MPKTRISWAGEALNFYTWNCTSVSPGCRNCYARVRAAEYPRNAAGGLFAENPQLREQSFEELRQIKGGQTVFVNTHSDTFHESVPVGWIRRIFQHMNQRQDLIFLLLTKRPSVALKFGEGDFGIHWSDNIWLGTSIENQTFYEGRLPLLLQSSARHKFISFEPLLSPVID